LKKNSNDVNYGLQNGGENVLTLDIGECMVLNLKIRTALAV